MFSTNFAGQESPLMFRRLYILFTLLLFSLSVSAVPSEGREGAASETDSLAVSLLTCSPGSLIYELYGHTAIRVKDLRKGKGGDWVFNYGTFSFEQPHFIRRFVLGETDYELSVLPYVFFYNNYMKEGRAVYEQRLNLTLAEQRLIADRLSRNLQPENAVYRYNFFYDNCTTRAIDQIVSSVDGEVVWGKTEEKTLRDIIHEFSDGSPWNSFGQDLLLGAEADRPADRKLQSFAPIYAMNFLRAARIKSPDGTVRPLAATPLTILPQSVHPNEALSVTPMCAFGILLALSVVITFFEWKRRVNYWGFDVFLLFAQGLVGCLIAFLFFFSAHPAVGSNYLLAMFNPLPLLYFPWFMKHAAQRQRDRMMYVQCGMLLLTLAFGVLGLQAFPAPLYLIVLMLALRAVWHLSRPDFRAASKRRF